MKKITGNHGFISFDSKNLFADLDHAFPLALRLNGALLMMSQINKGKFNVPLTQISSVKINNVAIWGYRLHIGTSSRDFFLRFDKQRRGEFEAFVGELQDAINASSSNVKIAIEVDDSKVCPECAESVKMAARKCRYCSYEFDQ